jgi:hypothetical protein
VRSCKGVLRVATDIPGSFKLVDEVLISGDAVSLCEYRAKITASVTTNSTASNTQFHFLAVPVTAFFAFGCRVFFCILFDQANSGHSQLGGTNGIGELGGAFSGGCGGDGNWISL